MEAEKCNCCGKEFRAEQGILKEDRLAIQKDWGYFSDKDMETHRIFVCEACYDKWVSGFRIPPEITDRTEAL